jgi:hypothetical protein
MSRQTAGQDPQQVAIESVRRSGDRTAAVVSAIALIFSAYSLWESSLKSPDVRVFVPPVIHYAAPYQNSNFEMISIPVTFTNEGARTGTVLSIGLEVTNPRSNESKRFYAAELGRWSMERTRSGAYEQFAPLSLAGHSSRTEAVLFYTRGEQEKPDQLIRDVGSYTMKLTLDLAEVDEFGWLDRLWKVTTPSVTFERNLRFYDARAFTSGTLPLYDKDWQASVSGK